MDAPRSKEDDVVPERKSIEERVTTVDEGKKNEGEKVKDGEGRSLG